MKTVLFQGDSITDAGRSTAAGSQPMGQGYPVLVAGTLGYRFPDKYSFINRGVSGNRIVDLYARVKADIWNLRPDVLSILIGVNDVWHEVSHQNGVDAVRFENIYRLLIKETLDVLPDVRIMILEPYVLCGSATKEAYDLFRPEVEKRAQAAKRIADDYGLMFVPLQEKLDAAAEKYGAEMWASDGVHPTPSGHGLIADAFIEAFEKIEP